MCGFSQRKLRNRYKMTYVNYREQRRLQKEIFKNETVPLGGGGGGGAMSSWRTNL